MFVAIREHQAKPDKQGERLAIEGKIVQLSTQSAHRLEGSMIKIMVVDDDEDFTNLYKTILQAAGFNATIVNRSSVAIEMAYLVQPEIFVIDLMMPDIDGFQLCRMIREDPVVKTIPIIVVTALTDMENKKAATDAGANAYLTKPFHIDELKSTINVILEKSNG